MMCLGLMLLGEVIFRRVKDPAASNGVFDPRGSRQIAMPAWLLGSLLAGINIMWLLFGVFVIFFIAAKLLITPGFKTEEQQDKQEKIK